MKKHTYFIGLDIAKDTFVASIYQTPEKHILIKEGLINNPEGYRELLLWLGEHKVTRRNSQVCMEATGVYSQGIAYYLLAQGYKVTVESPLKVKRAFHPAGHKTDPVDSRQIAEYAYRFCDELIPWQPKDEPLEKMRQLLSLREQFTKQKVAIKNAMASYKLERVQVPLINKAHKETLAQLERQIERIDQEIDNIIKGDPNLTNRCNNLKSIPGIGMMLATHLLVMTDNFTKIDDYKVLSSYIGLVPYQHQSGKSVHKRAHIRHYGPNAPRKLLRLAAQSVATHDVTFRRYYKRKLLEGKAKALVLNNISNKLIKIACAIVRDNTQYIKEHRSVHPMYA